jgi:uncharacterized membrane protein
MEKRYMKYSIVMILLFLVGGFSFVSYIFQAYLTFWGIETFPPFRERSINSSFENNRSFENRIPSNPESVLTSPFSLMLLIDGIFSIAGGISLWQLIREKELTTVKENISSLLLTPEEKAIIEELKKAGGQLNQNQLVKRTGLSKVKVHRALVRLEVRKVVKKYPYGLTNKIILEKSPL